MSPEEFKSRIQQHYNDRNEPLFLADLGKELRYAGLWPIVNEKRSLGDYIKETVTGVSIIRDPGAKAFAMVVLDGQEHIANQAVNHRQNVSMLKSLPRPILLAFCVENDPSLNVFLRHIPPQRYEVGEAPPDADFLPVEREFRSPGLFVADLNKLTSTDAQRLADGIKGWEQKHGVQLERASNTKKTTQSPGTIVAEGTTALERLYAAQPTELSGKLVVPLDIAITLSRMK